MAYYIDMGSKCPTSQPEPKTCASLHNGTSGMDSAATDGSDYGSTMIASYSLDAALTAAKEQQMPLPPSTTLDPAIAPPTLYFGAANSANTNETVLQYSGTQQA